MRLDAHYYGVLGFSRACGFNKESACRVAYASQFVDDASINYIMIKGQPGSIQYDLIDNKPAFFNMAASSSYRTVKAFNYCTMVNNTIAFHFVPGCRGESFVKKLRCMEESPIILELLDRVLKQDDLIALGIVLHGYADTFSHQGFSGLLSKVNDITECTAESALPWLFIDGISLFLKDIFKPDFDNLYDVVIPAYGHAQAWIYPDLPYLTWSYKYDYTDEFSEVFKLTLIDNRRRYKQAFQKIRIYLEEYLARFPKYRDKNNDFKDFPSLFDTLLTEGTSRGRISNWEKLLVRKGLFNQSEIVEIKYDKEKWLKEAFVDYRKVKYDDARVEGAVLSPNLPNSNWYKFCKAVKWYKKNFFECCTKNSLYIPR